MRRLNYAFGLGAVLLLASIGHAQVTGYYFGNYLTTPGGTPGSSGNTGVGESSTGSHINGDVAVGQAVAYISGNYTTSAVSQYQADVDAGGSGYTAIESVLA